MSSYSSRSNIKYVNFGSRNRINIIEIESWRKITIINFLEQTEYLKFLLATLYIEESYEIELQRKDFVVYYCTSSIYVMLTFWSNLFLCNDWKLKQHVFLWTYLYNLFNLLMKPTLKTASWDKDTTLRPFLDLKMFQILLYSATDILVQKKALVISRKT